MLRPALNRHLLLLCGGTGPGAAAAAAAGVGIGAGGNGAAGAGAGGVDSGAGAGDKAGVGAGAGVVQVAAGWEHSLALSAVGRVYSWGSGYKDSRRGVVPPVLGLGHNEGRDAPEAVAGFGPEGLAATKLASGWDHCLVLGADGRIYRCVVLSCFLSLVSCCLSTFY